MAARTKKFSLWTFADRFEGDKVVWIILLMLCMISIVCMFSSTSRLVTDKTTRLDMVSEQIFFVAFGLAIIIGLYNIKNINVFRKLSMLGFPLSFVLLLLLDTHVDLKGVVKALNINEAYRILQVGGMQIHVFEVVKVAMVLYLAWALDAFKKGELKGRMSDRWKKILYIYAPFLITFVMVIPGSNSSALLIGGIMFVVILLGGGNFKDMSTLFFGAVLAVAICFGIFKISDGTFSNSEIGIYNLLIGMLDDAEPTILASQAQTRKLLTKSEIERYEKAYAAYLSIFEKLDPKDSQFTV